ncbi:hypothetical protein PENTCL1PPCAC_4660, partial [Pristionchus entomophagus]
SFKTSARLCEEANRFIAFMDLAEMDEEDYNGSTIYLFNPITNEWTNVNTPKTPNCDSTVAVIGRQMFFIGGLIDNVDSPEYRHRCLVFDTQIHQWTETPRMLSARGSPAVGVIDGKIYAAGGNVSNDDALSTVETYCPLDDQPEWMPSKPMLKKRSRATSCVLDGKLYVLGGSEGNNFWNDGECYDPESDSWTLIAPRNVARHGFSAASCNGFIYVAG